MLTQNQLDQVRQNVLDASAGIVANKREELLEIVATCRHREALCGRSEKDGIDWPVVDALQQGCQNAPPGVVVYHHKLHLLTLFDALDLLQDAIDAASAPPAVAEAALESPVAEGTDGAGADDPD